MSKKEKETEEIKDAAVDVTEEANEEATEEKTEPTLEDQLADAKLLPKSCLLLIILKEQSHRTQMIMRHSKRVLKWHLTAWWMHFQKSA